MLDERASPSVSHAGGEGSDETDSQHTADKQSVGSNESKGHEQSKLGALIDKAKSKGKKLVSGKKKNQNSDDAKVQCSLLLPVECSPSEDNDSKSSCSRLEESEIKESEQEIKPPFEISDPLHIQAIAHKYRTMPFYNYRVILMGILIAVTLVHRGFITGILWGLYISLIGFLYLFVSDPKPPKTTRKLSFSISDLGDGVEEGKEVFDGDDGGSLGVSDGVVYKGWMNELRARYSPANYHVNYSQSVLVRLEGSTLRVCRPAKTVMKHAFHADPTLQQAQPTMQSQTIYDLTDAQVLLRPRRLARRRWWSRKYPIYIRFAHKKSALMEIDKNARGSMTASTMMTRSISLNQTSPSGSFDGLPSLPSICSEAATAPVGDEGYSAESDDTEDEGENNRVVRSNSSGDLADFKPKSKGVEAKTKGRSIYLFARAAREKERWFHLLREACAKARGGRRPKMERCHSEMPVSGNGEENEEAENETAVKFNMNPAFEYIRYKANHDQFIKQMLQVLCVSSSKPERGSTVSVDLGTMKWKPGGPSANSELVDSINSFAYRVFFDFCRDTFWIQQVKRKIQSKLATIHLPYFIDELELTELDLGTTAPKIHEVYAPTFDEWGSWLNFQIKYSGGIRLVLQTRVNLLKLQSGALQVEAEKRVTRWTESVRVARYSDSDLPESPESSPDEDFGSKNNVDGSARSKTGRKIFTLVEKAAQSSLFQKAAKIPTVARLLEDVSTTNLMLNVSVDVLEGPATINIPPPPSDRLWYGFRKVPLMSLKAVPQVGDRNIDLSPVSDWIESKLILLLEKNLVAPNLDDLILPVMSGNTLLHMGYNK
ncbi:hypothetical protein WR25_26185 [Diploscapter pachys]|uniref:SMP-LTD domain-containing protein n=1 Tax=Diploscapter pachys TaxID=2018661 RepID=A0A2A2KWB5_9BILA|nr:hypothetical protein WR25_26185 [Diploscapter pachys]